MTIALIDYGAGNPTSVRKAFVHLGATVLTPEDPRELSRVAGAVVPGVGHFGATASLDESWRAAVRALVDRGRPLLGICLGMQWLFEGSTEAPDVPGLALFAGQCRRLHARAGLKVPHVGWNSLDVTQRSSWLLAGVSDQAQVYFTHSFIAPVGSDCVAATTHGEPFAAVVERDGVCGVQFHPEKSGDVGLTLLRNFLARAGNALQTDHRVP